MRGRSAVEPGHHSRCEACWECIAVSLESVYDRTAAWPGLALLIASGVVLVVTGSGMLRKRWVRIMVIAAAGIVGNGLLLVLPAVRPATQLAEASVAAGHLVAGYHHAYMRESLAGDVNIALGFVAMLAGVWGVGESYVAARQAGAAVDHRASNERRDDPAQGATCERS
jgi:hypothetical protein